MNPRVSVIIPTFNSEKYVRRALESLRKQSIDDFEVIVVDAGSTDKTESIVRSFDGRFQWLVLAGVEQGTARNFGIKHARGAYVTFLDSDDFYLPHKLKTQCAELDQKPDILVTFCQTLQYRTGNPQMLGTRTATTDKVLGLIDFLSGECYNINTIFARKQLWNLGYKFPEGESGRLGEEWNLQLSLALGGVPMSVAHTSLVVVEMRPDSHTVWSRQWPLKKHNLAVFEAATRKTSNDQREAWNICQIADQYRTKLIIAYLISGKIREALLVTGDLSQDRRRIILKIVIYMAKVLPGVFTAFIIRWIWLAKQNRSYKWERSSESILAFLKTISA